MNNYNNDRGGRGGFNKSRGGSDRGGFGGGNRSHGGGHRGGGGNKFGGGRDRDDRPKEMHTATCATCQKSCQVPFRPSGDKPVYCSDCFSKQSDGGRDSRGGDRDRGNGPRPNSDNRFPARQEHPNDRKQSQDGEIKQRLATIEAKLNKILDLINPPQAPVKKVETPKVKKEVDLSALKEAVTKATKKTPAKKAVAKKAPAKKAVAKKAPAKKAVTKKAPAKKAAAKKVVKKKK